MVSLPAERTPFVPPAPRNPTDETRYWTARRLKAMHCLIIDDMSEVATAREVGRSRDYVIALKRHPLYRARADSMLADVQAELVSLSYGHKGRRLLSLDETARRLDTRERTVGITYTDTRYDKDGNIISEREVVDKDALSEKRAVLHAIAEELGQLPRAGDTGVSNLVLIREVNVHIER